MGANEQTVVRFIGGRFATLSGREDGATAPTVDEIIEAVFDALAVETLCPSLAPFGCASAYEDGYTHFFGNFENLSLAFGIDTKDVALIDRFATAIKANIGTSAYRTARHEYMLRQDAKSTSFGGPRPFAGRI